MNSAHVCLIGLAALLCRGPMDNAGFTHAGATGSSSVHVTVQSSGSTTVLLQVLRSSNSARLIPFTLAEDRPDDPGILVRQGYRGDILVASAHQLIQPIATFIRFLLAVLDR